MIPVRGLPPAVFFCVDPGCEGLLDMCCLGTWVLWCTWTYSVETVCLDDGELRHGFIFYAFLTSFRSGISRLVCNESGSPG